MTAERKPFTERVWSDHEHYDRRDVPRIKREWQGRRVAVHYMLSRGHYRKRTQTGWCWGTVSTGERDDQLVVATKDGPKAIHYTRVLDIFDLSRPKGQRDWPKRRP